MKFMGNPQSEYRLRCGQLGPGQGATSLPWECLQAGGGVEPPEPLKMDVQLGTRRFPDVLVSSPRVMQRLLFTDTSTLCLI